MAVLRNLSTGRNLARAVDRAVSGWQKLVGLIPCHRIEPNRGMWFDGCTTIHTLGMRSAIDVVFLDARLRVIGVSRRLPPNVPFVSRLGARAILEMGPGFLDEHEVWIGDRLALIEETHAVAWASTC